MLDQAATGQAISVLGSTVQIAPPRGYCVDPTATREDNTGAFVLFGTCRGVLGQGPRAPHKAILTAAVAPGNITLSDNELAKLAEFLGTEAGKRALSRTGDGADLRVDSIERAAGVLLVHANEADENALAADYWRAVFVQSGALVTVTVSSFAKAPLETQTAKAIAVDFVAATRAANALPAPPPDVDLTEPVVDETTEKPKGLTALFKRLL